MGGLHTVHALHLPGRSAGCACLAAHFLLLLLLLLLLLTSLPAQPTRGSPPGTATTPQGGRPPVHALQPAGRGGRGRAVV